LEPTQTAVLTCGVKPTIQASEFSFTAPAKPWVPVFAAESRPSASGSFEYCATGFIAYVTSLATLSSSTCCGLSACT
jgi:hypothetical protein